MEPKDIVNELEKLSELLRQQKECHERHKQDKSVFTIGTHIETLKNAIGIVKMWYNIKPTRDEFIRNNALYDERLNKTTSAYDLEENGGFKPKK